jgi:hypothetical protein
MEFKIAAGGLDVKGLNVLKWCCISFSVSYIANSKKNLTLVL